MNVLNATQLDAYNGQFYVDFTTVLIYNFLKARFKRKSYFPKDPFQDHDLQLSLSSNRVTF